MKTLGKFEQDIVDGGKAKAELGVAGEMLELNIGVQYPIAKLIEPAMGVVDSLVDKLEALIPGDQKEMAAKAKAEAREQLVKAFSEQA